MKTLVIFIVLSLCVFSVYGGSKDKKKPPQKKKEKEDGGIVKMLYEMSEKCKDDSCPVSEEDKKAMLKGTLIDKKCNHCLVKCMVCTSGMCDDKEQLDCDKMMEVVKPHAKGKENMIEMFMVPKCKKIGKNNKGCDMGKRFMEEYGQYMPMMKS